MSPTAHVPAKKSEAKNLPLWVTIPVALAIAYILDELCGFARWQRFAVVAAASVALEGANQAVRRLMGRKRPGGNR
ncbi:hypothetical protein ACQEVS_14740 [Streptomyces sp. CA-181903]|uniref:hypothetical protein n=1 Tax=Streptomyces sp. CA-181903 TaxID=3240055 RepID=UPI003D91C69D